MSTTAQYDIVVSTKGTQDLATLQANISKFTAEMKRTQGEAQKFSQSTKTAVGGFNNMGSRVQQVGFQIQDFAVQVAGGTSAVRAFSQQAPQLASAFGPVGVVLGTALAILVPLAASFLGTAEDAKTFGDSISDLKGAIGEYQSSLKETQAIMNDAAWANSSFGKMLIEQNKVLETMNLQKVRTELKATATALAQDFSTMKGSITSAKQVFEGIDKSILSSVPGIKEFFNTFRDGSKSVEGFYATTNQLGDNFVSIVQGLRNWGVEANTAAELTRNLLQALESGDMRAVAEAASAVSQEIARVGEASGMSAPQIAQAQSQLATIAGIAGGVVQGMNAMASGMQGLGATAAQVAGQVSALVAQLSALNLSGAAASWQGLKDTYSESGAAGAVNKFTTDFTANLKANAAELQKQADAVKDQVDPLRSYGREKEKINNLTKAGLISDKEAAKAIGTLDERLAKLTKTAGGGGGGGKKGKGGGGGGGGGASGALEKFKDSISGMSPEAQKLSADIRKMEADFAKFRDKLSPEEVAAYNQKLAEMKGKLNELGNAASGAGSGFTDLASQMKSFAESIPDTLASGLTDAFMSIIDGSKSAKEAFIDMAKNMLMQMTQMIIKMVLMAALQKAMGGLFGGIFGGGGAFSGGQQMFAQGAAFAKGVQQFANGGSVVTQPTYFQMAGGRTGLMGEAGPEAILPLRRKGGRLGVEASGGGSEVNVTVINNSSAQVRTRKTDNGLTMEVVEEQLATLLTRGGNKVDSALSRGYNLKRSGR